ncbi:hypothetical protein PSHT_14758 [Puccinia striiformis]|uniref:Kinetochore protein SPC25 n=1 Tax=Puccinia striiformis TaxID=27350 RepID=A0A2S4UIN7_9BASI|nr:hypothetical protein PSHT_14758 [Puccinia striiformis]
MTPAQPTDNQHTRHAQADQRLLSQLCPSQLGSSVSKVNRFLSPTKKRQMIFEHQKTNAKCELAVIQKQLTENIEANDKLKLELIAARNRLNKLSGDSREMELKLSELHSSLILKLKMRSNFYKDFWFNYRNTGPDRLRFNFKLIDMNAYDRVFYIELDLSEFDYRIISIDPSPPEIKSILKRLNQTRDFNRLVRVS